MENYQETEVVRFKYFWTLFLYNWYWFLISMVIFLFIGFTSIYLIPPKYNRTSSILIRDNSKSVGNLDNMIVFGEAGIFKSNININNEVLTLQSSSLMMDVIVRLNLNEEYFTKDCFRKNILYKNSPVMIVYDNYNLYDDVFCEIHIKENEFTITGLKINDEKFNDLQGRFNESVDFPTGKISVLKTNNFNNSEKYASIYYSKINLAKAVNEYLEKLEVSLGSRDATFINLKIEDILPDRGDDILKTLIEVYNENWIKDKNLVAFNTSQFINDRLRVIENELGNVDDSISSFKSKNLLPDVETASRLYMNQLSENNNILFRLNNQLSIVRFIRKYLKEDNSKYQLIPANSGIENLNIEKQVIDYNSMVLQRNNLLSNSSEKNPLVMDLNANLHSMKDAIIKSIDNIEKTLQMQMSNLNKFENKTNEQISSNPTHAKYLLSVERQQKVKESLYLFLLEKREENELSQAFTAYNTTIINPPGGPLLPTSPKKNLIILSSFLMGLFFPLGVIVLKENLNTTISGRNDLKNLTVPILGYIPQINLKKNELVAVEEMNMNIINEAFRIVRTNLDYQLEKSTRTETIMFTSFGVGDGKTFVSINLAKSVAIKNKKIVLVDLDIRKDTLGTYVNSPEIGVSDYLDGRISDLDEIIFKGQIHPNLDIIPVGIIPNNPTELLLENRLPYLIEFLRNKYDYIFLNCPPTELVADTLIINKVVDRTVFILRKGVSDKKLIYEVEKCYKENRLTNMSIVLNGVDFLHGTYSSYGYGKNKKNNSR